MAIIRKFKKLCIYAMLALVFTSITALTPFSVNAAAESTAGLYDDLELIPGGMTFGVQLQTKGVLVIGTTEIKTADGTECPAASSGIGIGDIIYEIDRNKINTVNEITKAIEECGGKNLSISVLRSGKKQYADITPVISETDGKYRAGLAVRDRTAGIGTVTFIDTESGIFAGLGHGICDADTGTLMPLLRGSVTGVSISGIKKGKSGVPGEIKGHFNGELDGALIGNTETGVYGILDKVPEIGRKKLPVASFDELELGKAYIYSTVENGKTEKYEIKILRITDKNRDSKNFIIELTDSKLLDKTGGIVQGMSGSPIIQNGKIIGAVTHVLIDNPMKGYGIFIENMLDNMPKLNKQAA